MKKKHKRKDKTRTLGDYEAELKIRDKKLDQEAEKARAKNFREKRVQGKKPRGESLHTIQKRGNSVCQECGRKKSIVDFYAYYNDLDELIKIFPMCKICDRKHHRSGRSTTIAAQRAACLEHYGKARSGKLRCSSCKDNDFDTLVLFSERHKNTRAIATDKTYTRLSNFNFPDVKFIVLCYNCAYRKIHLYKNT